MNFTRDEMVNFLRQGKSTVVFTKVDGTERVMKCTLNESFMPSEQRPTPPVEGSKPRQESLEAIRVFDTDIQAWRSFRVDSVKAFTPSEI